MRAWQSVQNGTAVIAKYNYSVDMANITEIVTGGLPQYWGAALMFCVVRRTMLLSCRPPAARSRSMHQNAYRCRTLARMHAQRARAVAQAEERTDRRTI